MAAIKLALIHNHQAFSACFSEVFKNHVDSEIITCKDDKNAQKELAKFQPEVIIYRIRHFSESAIEILELKNTHPDAHLLIICPYERVECANELKELKIDAIFCEFNDLIAEMVDYFNKYVLVK